MDSTRKANIECPQCSSKQTRRNAEGSCYCDKCKLLWWPVKNRAAGSGVIAQPRPQEREFRPLQRDPFAHMRLAMSIKRA